MDSKKKQRVDWFEDVESPAQSKVTPPSAPKIRVIKLVRKAKQTAGHYINCTTSQEDWGKRRDLTPFCLGPCHLYGDHVSQTVENAWQFSKVYDEHIGEDGLPTADYFEWAKKGWSSMNTERHPMGKETKAKFHWWDGRKLTRVEARKAIYVPLYVEQVTRFGNRTFEGLTKLWALMTGSKSGAIYLMDYDAYDYSHMTLTDVLNNEAKSMGHGFVIAMLLLNDPALKQCQLRPGTSTRP